MTTIIHWDVVLCDDLYRQRCQIEIRLGLKVWEFVSVEFQ